jgi:hypothetical protein
MLAFLALVGLPQAHARPALAEGQPALYVDADTTDGPCTDIDNERTVMAGETFQVAVCARNLSHEVGVFQLDVLYETDILSVPDVTDVGLGLDDNPDGNAGNTTWGDSLGDDFDCSSGAAAYPAGNRPVGTEDRGAAFISCSTIFGPWWLGDDETEGVIAVITMQGKGKGTAELTFSTALLADGEADEFGTCEPQVRYPMECSGATIHVSKEGAALAWPALLGIGLGVAVAVVAAVSVPFYLRRRRLTVD